MPNKQLTAKVRLNTTQAETKLKQLGGKINNLNKNINKLANACNQVDGALGQINTNTNRAKNATDKWATSAGRVNKQFRDGENILDRMSRTIRRIGAAYFGIMGVRAVLDTSDTITSAENRLNAQNGNNGQLTQESMNKIYAASMRSRSGYTDMLSNVGKSMTLASGAFGGNIDNAIKFQEIMSKAYTVGGASAAEQSSSMYQLIQALGSGVLQGDELRSVREGAPMAYKAIEEFAQGVFNTETSLKELASQGVITSDIVVAAIMNMEKGADNINDKFANTATTFAQAWVMIKNMAVQAFKPVLQMLNDALNTDMGQAVLNGIGQALLLLSNIILFVGNALGNLFTWISDNWNWISKLLLSLAVILGTVLLGALILNLMTVGGLIKKFIVLGIKGAMSWLTISLPLTIVLALLAAVVIALIWVSDSFEDACGIIVGVIMSALAFVWNLIVGIVNAIIQFLWAFFVEGWIGVIEWILNVFNGGFNSFGDGVKNLLGNIISWFLSLGQVVTKIIDAIFGTNWTGGLESLKDNVLKWGKNEEAITLKRDGAEVLNRWSYSDAYNTGYDWGKDAGGWISDKVGSLFNFDDTLNQDKWKLNDMYDQSAINDDIANGLKTLGNIEDDTKGIKDSIDLSNDDMEYLRRVAEMEWRNEFTTAEIRVDMTNNNTVASDRDLDGMVAYLSDTLREELTAISNGVHIDD